MVSNSSIILLRYLPLGWLNCCTALLNGDWSQYWHSSSDLIIHKYMRARNFLRNSLFEQFKIYIPLSSSLIRNTFLNSSISSGDYYWLEHQFSELGFLYVLFLMIVMLMMISLYSLYFINSIILNNFNYLHDKSSSSIMPSSSYCQAYINLVKGIGIFWRIHMSQCPDFFPQSQDSVLIRTNLW